MDELIDFLEAIPRIAMSPVTQVLDAVGPDWPCSSEITAVSPDLPKDDKSGLGDAIRKVEVIEGIGTVRFSDVDVVRHPLAAKIVQAYEEWDRKKKTPASH